MIVDAVNENVKEDDDEEEDEVDTEDGSIFECMFDSEQENRQPITNIRLVYKHPPVTPQHQYFCEH